MRWRQLSFSSIPQNCNGDMVIFEPTTMSCLITTHFFVYGRGHTDHRHVVANVAVVVPVVLGEADHLHLFENKTNKTTDSYMNNA